LPNIPKWLPPTAILFSLAGFIVASYLAVMHFLSSAPSCLIVSGCDTVAFSKYSDIGGVPVAMLGLFLYAAELLLVIAYLDTNREGFLRIEAYLTIIGFIASLWFTYVQFFILDAYCFFCLLSAAFSIILFIVGIMTLTKYRQSLSSINK